VPLRCSDPHHFPGITFVQLSGSIRSGNPGAARPPGPTWICHTCPLPAKQGPSFASSEQVAPSARPSLNLLQSRVSIPLVLVLHPTLAGDKCARPSSDDSGLELSRLLLNRLKVLAAAPGPPSAPLITFVPATLVQFAFCQTVLHKWYRQRWAGHALLLPPGAPRYIEKGVWCPLPGTPHALFVSHSRPAIPDTDGLEGSPPPRRRPWLPGSRASPVPRVM
jgi:hypothetical protein